MGSYGLRDDCEVTRQVEYEQLAVKTIESSLAMESKSDLSIELVGGTLFKWC